MLIETGTVKGLVDQHEGGLNVGEPGKTFAEEDLTVSNCGKRDRARRAGPELLIPGCSQVYRPVDLLGTVGAKLGKQLATALYRLQAL
jgi:hypothetical protein